MLTKTVIKRDKSEEEFDKTKVARVVMAAGLLEDKAAQLGDNIEAWVNSQPQDKITSLAIRDQVLVLLKEADEYAANMFEWYQRTKDVK